MIGSQKIQQHSRLGNLLIRKGWLSSEQLEQALVYQRKTEKKLGESLIELGFINQAQLNKALTKQSWSRSTIAGVVMAASQIFITACGGGGGSEKAGTEINQTVTNNAPSVNITSPSGGDNYEENQGISFTATASDTEDGDLSSNIIWSSSIDGQLGSGSAINTTLSIGSHVITASVTDSEGAQTNRTVSISVSEITDTAPSLSIDSPSSGDSFTAGAMINFTAGADDSEDGDISSSISWSSNIDGNLGTGASISAPLSAGNHTITAMVTDSGGNLASQTVNLSVQAVVDLPPEISITSPTSGASFDEGQSVSFTANAVDNEDGNLGSSIRWVSSVDGNLGTGASITATLSPGAHSITASVIDSEGNQSSESVSIAVNTVSDDAPQLAITSPSSGSTFNEDDVISFTANASDTEDGNIGSNISWSSNLDGSIGTGSSINTTLTAGNHTISAVVTDSDGNQVTQVISLVVESAVNVVPVINITSPSSGSDFQDDETITFTATATDEEDGDLGGQVQWDSNIDGNLGTGASITTTLSAGSHIITASVTDSEGEVVSEIINLNVSAATDTAPEISITAPVGGSSFGDNESITFTATATDEEDGDIGSNIIWYSDIEGQIGQGNSISVTLGEGQHLITAEITDSQGNVSESEVQISVAAADGLATVSWQAPTENTDDSELTDLAGFKIYYGEDENALDEFIVIEDPEQLSYDFSELTPDRTYYFGVTAYNSFGIESEMSTVVSKQL